MNINFGGNLKKNGNGKERTGYGSSFKEALTYYLHDKRPDDQGPRMETAERVGFVHLHNLATDDPGKAWREMVDLCNVANMLQKEAAAAEGKKYKRTKPLEAPVFTFSLDFHEQELAGMGDAERVAHMRDKAMECLAAIGLESHQAVLVEHLPELRKDGTYTSPHVHVCANVIDPMTGRKAPMKFYETNLRNWAAAYEIERGVIVSPTAHKNYLEYLAATGRAADKRRLEAIQKMALKHITPKQTGNRSRDEWKARKDRDNGKAATAEAAAIKKRFNEDYRKRRQREDEIKARHTAERNAAWLDYKAEKAKLWDAYKPQIDKHWQRPRRGQSGLSRLRAYFNDPRTAWREDRERAEWKALGRRQWQERRAFQIRERTFMGAVNNAIRLSSVGTATVYQGRLAGVFHLTRNADERRRLFELQQEQQKKAVRDMQTARKKAMSDPVRQKRDAELKALAEAYDRKRDEIEARQRMDWLAAKAERAASNQERGRAWDEWRERFNITDRPGYTKPGRKADDRPALAEWAENREDTTQPPTQEPRREFTAFTENKQDVTTPTPFKDMAKERDNTGGRERAKPAPGKNPGPQG